MFWLKIAAGLVVVIIALAWYPFGYLCTILALGLGLYSWQQETDSRHAEVLKALKALAPDPPSPSPDSPPLPRIGFTSQEEYVTYMQAHGLPWRKVESMWSDGS